tara:strand:- start:326 stop:694 length:369 start_codon:yes stop_codon:yes gene_type:complete
MEETADILFLFQLMLLATLLVHKSQHMEVQAVLMVLVVRLFPVEVTPVSTVAVQVEQEVSLKTLPEAVVVERLATAATVVLAVVLLRIYLAETVVPVLVAEAVAAVNITAVVLPAQVAVAAA